MGLQRICDVCGEPLGDEPVMDIPEAARLCHKRCWDDEKASQQQREVEQLWKKWKIKKR